MPYDTTTMVANYTTRLDPTRIKEDLDANGSEMITAFDLANNNAWYLEGLVRGLLVGDDTTKSFDIAQYMGFAKRLDSIRARLLSGAQLISAAAAVEAGYVALGLNETNLSAIKAAVLALI